MWCEWLAWHLAKAALWVDRGGVSMSAGRCYRCSMCNGLWPFMPLFSKCPDCGHKCWSKPIREDDEVATKEEAMRVKSYTEFKEYCHRRDEKLLEDEIDRLRTADWTVDDFVCDRKSL